MSFVVAWNLLTPANLLWFVGSFVALTLLFGSMNMRRSKLTDVLRKYVERKQSARRKDRPGKPSDD